MDFISRVDEELDSFSSRTDEATYHHVANSLQGTARKWLFSMADMDTEDSSPLIRSNFRDQFKDDNSE
jgi:hypothetical protein